MGKILYLATKPPDTNTPDSNVNQLGSKLARPTDLEVKIISNPNDLQEIALTDYVMIAFDPEISISPWKITKEIKSSLGKNPCPSFWIEGDMSAITKNFLEANYLTGSVLVTKNLKEAIATCNGKIDGHLDSEAPNIEMKTPHNICSIGKMLTGLTVLQLIQQGKLNLTDKIYDYLPKDFPNRKKFKEVNVSQLLTHTAGMGNYSEKYGIALNDPYQEAPQFKTLQDFVKFIDNPDSLNIGTHKYSNVGYVVLGKVIEEAANKDNIESKHQSYWDVVTELVLKPNDITITRDKPLSENPATNSQYPTTIKIASSPAGANMWATPDELTKFANWLMQRIQDMGSKFKSQLEDLKVKMFSDEELYYSAGVMMGKDSVGQDFYYHNGGADGISSYLRIDPSTQMTETIFINNDSGNNELANGFVATQLNSYVLEAKANRIYYADPNFSDNPETLFQQVAKESGVELSSTLAVNQAKTRQFKEVIAQTRDSDSSHDVSAEGSLTPFKTQPKFPGDF